MRKHYDKLVRDRIPERIAKDGHRFETRTLDRSEYLVKLREKLVEEAKEVYGSTTRDEILAELADVSEVVLTLADEYLISTTDLETERQSRFAQRGGFQKRLLLVYVDEISQA